MTDDALIVPFVVIESAVVCRLLVVFLKNHWSNCDDLVFMQVQCSHSVTGAPDDLLGWFFQLSSENTRN